MASEEPLGTVRKSALILRCLAAADADGYTLAEVSRKVALPHPSVYRVLQVMSSEGLVRRDPASKRYTLGPLTFELGLAAGRQFDVRRILGSVLQWLVKETGDTVYLSMRSGAEEVCADRVEGSSVIVVRPLRIGSRRPLGLTAGGIAILSALDDSERESVITDVVPELLGKWNASEADLRELLGHARSQGYTHIRNRVTPGVSAVAMPIRDSAGRGFAALSIPATTDQMTDARIHELVPALVTAVRKGEAAMRSAGWHVDDIRERA